MEQKHRLDAMQRKHHRARVAFPSQGMASKVKISPRFTTHIDVLFGLVKIRDYLLQISSLF